MGISAQEITAELSKLVEVREDVTIFAIIHSRSGLELVTNSGDLVMKLGMLDVAKMAPLRPALPIMGGGTVTLELAHLAI